MNTLTLQKKAKLMESLIRKASRVLFEFEVAQSEWDIQNGRYKIYDSAKKIIPDIKRRLK